jgi:hypothetical protein
MPEFPCEVEGTNITLVGHFNPSIFQPSWLVAYNLIRKEEGDEAKIQVIAPQVTSFTADWLNLVVSQERFQASTNDPSHYEPLRDLVTGIFLLLEHTPFDKMGLNRNMHFRMPSVEDWHAFGHLLAPKDIWSGLIVKPGLKSLIIEGLIEIIPGATIRVKVEPSSRVHPGIYVGTNQHHEASGADAARQLMSTLREKWVESQEYARQLAEHLINEGYSRATRS